MDTSDSNRLARGSDPDSSHAAAAELSPTKNSIIKGAIIALLAESPTADWDLTGRYFEHAARRGWPIVHHDSIRKRRSELVSDGLVEDTGERIASPYGPAHVAVWRVAA